MIRIRHVVRFAFVIFSSPWPSPVRRTPRAPSSAPSPMHRARSCPASPSRSRTSIRRKRAHDRLGCGGPLPCRAAAPGRYEVTAQLSGFQTMVRSGITLTVGQQAVVDTKMSLGNVSESITVEGAAPLVETTTGTISNVVTEQQIGSMPLNGRRCHQLVLLQPGVVMSRSSVSGSNVGQGTKISVAGSRPSQNMFTLDGTALQRRAEQHAGQRERRDDRCRNDQGIPRRHQRR